jgi:hypothetical protein
MLPTQLTQKQKIAIGVAIALTLAVMALVLTYLISHPVFTAAVTDISIIVLAIVVLVMNVFLIVMMWQIIRLIDFLLFELKPVLQSLQETTSTVRGTADFVSEGVASPMIDAKAKAAGFKGSLRFVVGSLKASAQRTAGSPPGADYQDDYTPPSSARGPADAPSDANRPAASAAEPPIA